MKWLVIIPSLIFGIGTFIPFFKKDHWFFRLWEFPRPQLLFIKTACLIGVILVLEISPLMVFLVLLLAAALLYQIKKIFPYTFLGKKESKWIKESHEDQQISLLIFNVYMHNKKFQKTLDLVERENPDVVMLVETDKKWQKALSGLKDHYPYFIEYPLENTYGILFYSKLPIQNARVNFLVEKGIPSIFAQIQLQSGQWIDFYGIHPTPPIPPENDRSTERDIELILVGKKALRSKNPVIIAGDLNDVAWSKTSRMFQKISRLLDPRKGRGFFNTFHADYFFARWPLDHIFHSNNFLLAGIRRLPHTGSDHFPILASLQFNPGKEKVQSYAGLSEKYSEVLEEKLEAL
ncbi:endonuclease/exonuclease/phosphatase family protein [Flexithrix dorotheae]|uniref:endonuclease/exonuclease/phosphatase family protein n=1 Tax=Flexithrix dorotheae TaxID=70993 RepID=UPI00037175F1|nr:endonuclease/exonuclease/phosphatase family protein [Flexithrix dorotheae]